jgi:peroxiredoxin
MKIRLAAAFVAATLIAAPALTALPVGAKAPDFSAPATLAGKRFDFSLKQALKKGPVVLYFYPKAFTTGCTIEAHDFAAAHDDFVKQGATVIGVSADDMDTLDKFSVSDCGSKFAVGAVDAKLIKTYDVAFPDHPLSNRTTFVIAPNGKILWTFTALKPDGHVAGALKAVTDWRAAHPQRS